MHCGDPSRVRTSRVGRCAGFVQWAQISVLAPWPRRFPGRAVCTSYLGTDPTFLLQATTRGLRGWIGFSFLLIKVVQRRLRTQIQPLAGSALLASSTPNLASLTIVVVRLSVGLFLLLVECCRNSKLMFGSPFVF